MSRLAKAIRSHRENHRSKRDLARALNGASASLRDELLVIAQRDLR